MKHEPLIEIVCELDTICESNEIVGVHYTRAKRESISSFGLIPQSGAERRDAFLSTYGHHFTAIQRYRLLTGWRSYFDKEQNHLRDCRIWFNLTREAISNGSAESLLSYFGGEVIYMPFLEDPEIMGILRGIGEAMVIECSLSASSLYTLCEKPWGRTWLSSYHCSVNPEAFQWDVDFYTEERVSPSAILNIEAI